LKKRSACSTAMSGPLHELLPPDDDFDSDDLLGRSLAYVAGKGLTLYPVQEVAPRSSRTSPCARA
jgi:hypothetical protein